MPVEIKCCFHTTHTLRSLLQFGISPDSTSRRTAARTAQPVASPWSLIMSPQTFAKLTSVVFPAGRRKSFRTGPRNPIFHSAHQVRLEYCFSLFNVGIAFSSINSTIVNDKIQTTVQITASDWYRDSFNRNRYWTCKAQSNNVYSINQLKLYVNNTCSCRPWFSSDISIIMVSSSFPLSFNYCSFSFFQYFDFSV